MFAQADQQEIPDYVLDGKTTKELSLMRNEIFASYGLIFKSEYLQQHFDQKRWYTPKYNIVDSYLTKIDLKNIELIRAEENNLRSANYELVYENKSSLSIRKYKINEENSFIRKISKVDYIQVYNMGMIKIRSDQTDFGADGIPTVIFAETIDPEFPYWSTTKYCDVIVFDSRHYQTIKYGCCSAEAYHEFYTFQSELPFLKTNEEFFFVEIPNTGIDLFIGYNHEITNRDNLMVAELTLSTRKGVINTVKFKAKNLAEYDEMDAFLSPKVELVSKNPKNKVALKNRMTVWSKNFEKDLNKISDFAVKLTYTAYETGRKAVYEIPITNGCLNGNMEDQLITIEFKK